MNVDICALSTARRGADCLPEEYSEGDPQGFFYAIFLTFNRIG